MKIYITKFGPQYFISNAKLDERKNWARSFCVVFARVALQPADCIARLQSLQSREMFVALALTLIHHQWQPN